ncbi:hypothetical protein HY357_04170 [Candidatus Roizmanbacteria bacterium]|nr:hypothetical protein [Candidatus Roizmanbacteria bacterium]
MKRRSKIKDKRSKLNVVKGLFIIAVLTSVIPLYKVSAQTKIASPSQVLVLPTKSAEDNEIQSLKEKIATKVAELRQKNSKAVSGHVEEKTDKKIKIRSYNDQLYEISVDSDLTKYYQIVGTTRKEIKLSDIKKGSYIIVTGVMNNNKIEANAIYLDEFFLIVSGKVSEVNKQEFFIRAVTSDKENYTLDVETFTKQQMINVKTLVLEKVGFSKIKEGDTIHFVIKKSGTEKESNRFAAQKILIIPQEYFIK